MKKVIDILAKEILTASEQGKNRVYEIINHPKGTNCKQIANYFESRGYKVHMLRMRHYSVANSTAITLTW